MSLRLVEVNGGQGWVCCDERQRLVSVVALEIAGGQIQSIKSVVNPDKLRHLGPLGDWASLVSSAQ